MSARISFLLLGGAHHVFHTAPVAAALSELLPGASVSIWACDERSADLARIAASAFPNSRVDINRLRRSAVGDLAAWVSGKPAARKLPLLWRNRQMLGASDVIVVPECTSTVVRRMGVTRPRLICIPHGAGDRAVSFEPRFKLFDHIIVAGGKTADRMIESGVDPHRISIAGYPKADLLRRLSAERQAYFQNARPTVLYNPHFKRSLSSLDEAEAIVARFREQDRYNLILAPHIRAAGEASAAERARWEALAIPGKILVDLGSDRLVDMSYILSADLYLGDVSSQVYEFLLSPRPCVFVDAHGVNWSADPNYAFWRLGEVTAPAQVLAAVDRAIGNHGTYVAAQQAAVAATFGDTADACVRAAAIIAREANALPVAADRSTAAAGNDDRLAAAA